MADADIVGTNEQTTPQTRHWLVNGVGISDAGDAGPYPLNFTGSTAITNYAGPGPASGSGSHRCVYGSNLDCYVFSRPYCPCTTPCPAYFPLSAGIATRLNTF